MASVEKGMSRRQVLKAGLMTAAVVAGRTGDPLAQAQTPGS